MIQFRRTGRGSVPVRLLRVLPVELTERLTPPRFGEARASSCDFVAGMELVNVAKELNKLDELATALAIAAKEYPDQARQVNALEAILAIARGDAATTIDRLTKGVDARQTATRRDASA